jgi:hypothetical protein
MTETEVEADHFPAREGRGRGDRCLGPALDRGSAAGDVAGGTAQDRRLRGTRVGTDAELPDHDLHAAGARPHEAARARGAVSDRRAGCSSRAVSPRCHLGVTHTPAVRCSPYVGSLQPDHCPHRARSVADVVATGGPQGVVRHGPPGRSLASGAACIGTPCPDVRVPIRGRESFWFCLPLPRAAANFWSSRHGSDVRA